MKASDFLEMSENNPQETLSLVTSMLQKAMARESELRLEMFNLAADVAFLVEIRNRCYKNIGPYHL